VIEIKTLITFIDKLAQVTAHLIMKNA